MVAALPASWAAAAVLVGAALTGVAAGWWSLLVVLGSDTLPTGRARPVLAGAALAAGAILGAALALGLGLLVRHLAQLT